MQRTSLTEFRSTPEWWQHASGTWGRVEDLHTDHLANIVRGARKVAGSHVVAGNYFGLPLTVFGDTPELQRENLLHAVIPAYTKIIAVLQKRGHDTASLTSKPDDARLDAMAQNVGDHGVRLTVLEGQVKKLFVLAGRSPLPPGMYRIEIDKQGTFRVADGPYKGSVVESLAVQLSTQADKRDSARASRQKASKK